MPTVALSPGKGAATREAILERAYALACVHGLEGLTIGTLAEQVGMSKSGVFAHFGSREDLQLAVLDLAAELFGGHVLIPALRMQRGLTRLRAIIAGWFDWLRQNADGCAIIGAAIEYDGKPGRLRDRVVALLARWRSDTTRAIAMAIESGELDAETDAEQMSFEIFAIALALHQEARLFSREQAFRHAERAIERLLASAGAGSARSAPPP